MSGRAPTEGTLSNLHSTPHKTIILRRHHFSNEFCETNSNKTCKNGLFDKLFEVD